MKRRRPTGMGETARLGDTGRDRLLRRLRREERLVQLGRAALVGLVAGVAAAVYRLLVVTAEDFAQGLSAHREQLGLTAWLAIPVVTGILGALAAWLTLRFAPEAGGSGIPHTKAVLMGVREIRPLRLIAVKLGGGLLALAAGMSLGREGPTVQVGAATGKLVGNMLRVPRRSVHALIASGAGAGLAAAFNAPLAGFLFVMEELKKEMSALTYGTAFIGSVSAVLITRAFAGPRPSFLLPESSPLPFDALLPAVILGVLGGAAGVLFNRGLLSVSRLRPSLRGPSWLAGAAVGVVAGVVLLTFPRITGVGHRLAEEILSGHLESRHLITMALALFAGKFLLTVLSYGTGVPGGIFAPILVLGACLGYAFGLAADRLFPQVGVVPTVFATIGMAALLTGSVRAPLTGVVLIVEMTAEYNLLFALLLGCFAAHATAELLRARPIYEALLERDLRSSGHRPQGAPEILVIEVLVETDSKLAGRRLKEVDFPPGTRVAAVARGSREIVPEGNTRLQPGDLITVTIEGDAAIASAWMHEAARGV